MLALLLILVVCYVAGLVARRGMRSERMELDAAAHHEDVDGFIRRQLHPQRKSTLGLLFPP